MSDALNRVSNQRARRCAGRQSTGHRAKQRGVALLLVLWACALLAILLGGYALTARTEGLQAHYQFARTQARYAAEAGVARAAWAISQTDPRLRWKVDGHPYSFELDQAQIHVRITAEDGKIDLNTASPPLLQRFFTVLGVDPGHAEHLAAAIADWRDADDASLPNGAEAAQYRDAGRHYGPRNGPFASIEELQQVLGMDAALYAKAAPFLTLWSRRPLPNAAHAPLQVLEALPGMNHDAAVAFVRQRNHADPQQHTLLTLPNGSTVLAGGTAVTHSIRSDAVVDGVRARVRATIHRGGLRAGRGPYAVLQWEEGP